MAPRLTRYGRSRETRFNRHQGEHLKRWTSRPSPNEMRKARHLAYVRAIRKRDRETWRLLDKSMGVPAPSWPTPRGTTQGQLVAMHLEAEQ